MRAAVWGMAIGVCQPTICDAGGGPENLVLVVNADSAASKLLANYYIAGRQIPARNVIYLNGIPAREVSTLEVFREKIFKPVLQQIEERKLGNSVDYIVYSADFPSSYNISPHTKMLAEQLKNATPPQTLPGNIYGPFASLTSLTYFAGAVLSDQPAWVLLDSNTYYRKPASMILRQPFVGERQIEFDAATRAFDAGSESDRTTAMKTLTDMAKRNPRQVAVLYWLARFHAQNGDAKAATEWLTAAIRAGWCYRTQTKADLAFRKIESDPLFAGIVDRIPLEPFEFAPTRGFKQVYGWGVNGMLNEEAGQANRYFLSTMLGVTRNHGTTEEEAVQQLIVSIKADATFPRGTFYFSDTSDVRNKTRKPSYAGTIEALRRVGQQGEVITSILPDQKTDVLGLCTGSASVNWTASGSRLMPGAIAESLTSHGGRLSRSGQTKLSEFIRFGAAGSGGTVTEPYAIQAKFPHPHIHVHYAKGCSLAEAFYQSISGPFQYLIVGDALCQPWAKLPTFTVDGVTVGQTISGKTRLNFDASTSPVPIAGMELYVDGVLLLRDRFRDSISFDTTGLSDGYHEIRFVAIANNPIETTGRVIMPVLIDNGGFSTSLTASGTEYLDSDQITLTAKSNFGNAIELVHNMRSIAQEAGNEATFRIPASWLGRGPVSLEAISIDANGKGVASVPVRLEILGKLSKVKANTEEPPK